MFKKFESEIYLIIVSILWSTGFIGTKIAMDEGLNPLDFLFVRFLVAAILLFLVCLIKKKKLKKEDLFGCFITGITLSLGFIFQTNGIKYTTPAKNSLFTGLNIIFIPYIAYIFFREKIDKYIILASVLAFMGTFILEGDIIKIFTDIKSVNKGDLYSILGAVFFAMQVVFTGHYANKIDTWILSFMQFFIGTIMTLLVIIFNGSFYFNSYIGVASAVFLGVFCSFIASTLQIVAQKNLSSSKTAILLTLEIVFAMILSILLGYDHFSLSIIVGFSLIFMGIIIAETKLNFLKRR